MILVQQRKQAKIGFETFHSKYIKLCVSSDVGKKEIRSERKRTCFLRCSNMRFSIRALSINKLELRRSGEHDREDLRNTQMFNLFGTRFSAHLTDTIKQQLRENKTATAVIPGGLTSLVQPLDVCLNKPFKDRLREKWMTWMMSGKKTFTPGGQLRAASLITVCQWVKESWQELSKEMVDTLF